MKRLIYILFLLSCFFISNIIADEETEASLAQIKAQIDELEIAKVNLQKIIKVNEPEIDKTSNMIIQLLKVEKELDSAIKKNIYKTLIAGNINVILEIQGSSNAGKILDLGTWVVGKVAGVSMEKSGLFSSPAYYTKKMTQLNEQNIRLTVELKELYEASKKSDDEIQKHYDTHKKNDFFYDSGLGTLGTIQYRMKLVLSKVSPTIMSLKQLRTNHRQVVNQAKNELELTREGIALLRDRYQELNNAKDKKEDKNKLEEKLAKIDDVKREIKLSSSDITVNVPDKCKYYEDKANSLLNNYISLSKRYETVYEIYNEKMNKFYAEKEEKLNSINKEFEKKTKEIFKKYPNTAYYTPQTMSFEYNRELPFAKLLSNTRYSHNEYTSAKKSYISSIKELSHNILNGIPGESEEKILSQLIADINATVSGYSSLINSKQCSSTKSVEREIVTYEPIYEVVDGINIIVGEKKVLKIIYVDVQYFKSTNYRTYDNLYPYSQLKEHLVISKLKVLKKNLLSDIERKTTQVKNEEKSFADQYIKIRIHFRKIENEIKIALNQYIENENEIIPFNRQYIQKLKKLLDYYKNKNIFDRKSDGTHKEYLIVKDDWLLPKDIDEKNSCEKIQNIKNKILSPQIQNIVLLEKEIDSLQNSRLPRLYIPTYGYVHFPGLAATAENLKKTSDKLWGKRTDLNLIRLDNYSNLSSLFNKISNNKFYQLSILNGGIFIEIHDNQVKAAREIINVLKNTIIIVKGDINQKRIHRDTYKENKSIYDTQLKKFKNELSCLGKDESYNKQIRPLFEELKNLLPKLKSKSVFINANKYINQLENFKKEVENFGISDSSNHEKKYKVLLAKYNNYDKEINSKKELFFSLDFEKLYKLLNEIYPLFEAHRIHIEEKNKSGNEDANQELIKDLYKNFTNFYSNKNLPSLMNLLSDQWESSSDGTTLMDLEETLDNSFSVFDEINCSIENLDIFKLSANKYQISYVITIKGYIYDNDIKHLEKSSVKEEVLIENSKAKISKTLNGNFWPNN